MNTTRLGMFVSLSAFVTAAVLTTGCATSTPTDTLRVGSYNIRTTSEKNPRMDGPNCWNLRKKDLADLIRKMDLDVFGAQEVTPTQAKYLRETLPEFAFVGEHRNADRVSGEASPVFYRKSRFEVEKSGTFWLSETPEVPGKKGWGAMCPRVCSYLILKDKSSGRRFCFANTHTDHRSALAREKGMQLIISRMKDFGAGAPIVFTGDHNCRYNDRPAVEVRKILRDARDIAEAKTGPHDTFEGFGAYRHGPVDGKGKAYSDRCIDYIYVSDGTRVIDFTTYDDRRPGTDLWPSDHRPIAATIVLPD